MFWQIGYLCTGLAVFLIPGRVTRDRCYAFLNIFAEKNRLKIGVHDSKES
jgi:hypothetical protein